MMRGEKPLVADADENIGGLDDRFVKAVGKGGGDVLGTGDPANVAFDANPDRAQSDANAFGVGENAGPAAANLVPAEQQFTARLNALYVVIVRPCSFHLGHVEGFEGCVETLVRRANALFREIVFAVRLASPWIGK